MIVVGGVIGIALAGFVVAQVIAWRERRRIEREMREEEEEG